MKREYFKRLNYTYTDIQTKKFENEKVEFNNVFSMEINNFFKKNNFIKKEEIFDLKKANRMKNCGLGDLFIDEVFKKNNAGNYFKVENNAFANIEIHYTLDEKNNILFDQNYIEIGENAEVNLFIYLSSNNNEKIDKKLLKKYNKLQNLNKDDENYVDSYRNGELSIKIGKNSNVNLIKVQNFNKNTFNFETMRIDVAENTNLIFYEMQLGSYKSAISNTVYMKDEWSHVELYPIYFIDQSSRMDLEQNLVVNGKNCFSIINAKGALKDNANKTFRGNIFLNNGCSRSIARFADSDIILSKGIKAISIPTIFCDEDDVIGEHAASFEALNKTKMLYLMSRGFDEFSAKKLIILATFRPIFNMIENEKLRQKLFFELNERLK